VSRVDVPTLMCDRCEFRTQDTAMMASFVKITRRDGPVPPDVVYDLCPACWDSFRLWLAGDDQ